MAKKKPRRKISNLEKTVIATGIVFIGFVVIFVACGDDTTQQDNLYKNEAHGFSIEPPKGWDEEKGTGSTVVEFMDEEDGDFPNSLSIISEYAIEYTLDEYFSMNKYALLMFLPTDSFLITGDGKLTINGVDARYITYTFTFMNHQASAKHVILMRGDGMAFTMFYMALQDTYDNTIVDVDRSVSTFKFI